MKAYSCLVSKIEVKGRGGDNGSESGDFQSKKPCFLRAATALFFGTFCT